MLNIKPLLILILALFTLNSSAQEKKGEIIVDGLKREFITYVPQGWDKANKLPVVLSLHGGLGTDEGMFKLADFRPVADREHFLVVCPRGIDKSWNDGRETKSNKKNVDDVKFIDQLIAYIIKTYNADSTRIYATGMSNGGYMSSRLACQLSNRVAAIAAVGASMDSEAGYQPVKPISVMYIQGTKDPLVPYFGGKVKGAAGGAILGHEQTLNKWAEVAGYTGKLVITNLPDRAHDGTSVIKEDYTNPANGVKVIGYTIVDGGHTWPSGWQYLPKFIIGATTKNLNACEVIWAFFKGVQLK